KEEGRGFRRLCRPALQGCREHHLAERERLPDLAQAQGRRPCPCTRVRDSVGGQEPHSYGGTRLLFQQLAQRPEMGIDYFPERGVYIFPDLRRSSARL